jgi:hypothetical protein
MVALARGGGGRDLPDRLLSSIMLPPVWPAALLAKEAAGIDGISGAGLTLGIAAASARRFRRCRARPRGAR